MKLNCDLGRGCLAHGLCRWTWTIMAEIDQANIACGFHAGDPLVMKQAILSAKQHDVVTRCPSSLSRLTGIWSRSVAIAADELSAMIQYQVRDCT